MTVLAWDYGVYQRSCHAVGMWSCDTGLPCFFHVVTFPNRSTLKSKMPGDLDQSFRLQAWGSFEVSCLIFSFQGFSNFTQNYVCLFLIQKEFFFTFYNKINNARKMHHIYFVTWSIHCSSLHTSVWVSLRSSNIIILPFQKYDQIAQAITTKCWCQATTYNIVPIDKYLPSYKQLTYKIWLTIHF